MSGTKTNEAPERIWVNLDSNEDGCCPVEDDISLENIPDRGRFFHLPSATEYVRADLLADMTRQRDEARAEGFAAGLIAAIKLCDGIAGNTADFSRDHRRAAGQCGAAIRALAEGAKP